MTIDPAGQERRTDGRGADSWAIGVFGVEPLMDVDGASDCYLLDAVIEPMDLDEALKVAVAMYCRAGRVALLS